MHENPLPIINRIEWNWLFPLIDPSVHRHPDPKFEPIQSMKVLFFLSFSLFFCTVQDIVHYSAAGAATSSFFSSVAGGGGDGASFGSRSSSFRRSGRNLSMRFQVSVHSFSCEGSSLGGTRYPLLDMTRMMFFRLSGTASSYRLVSTSYKETFKKY